MSETEDRALRALFHSTFGELHPVAPAAAPHRVRRPTAVAVLCVFCACTMAVGVFAAGEGLIRRWTGVFGSFTATEQEDGTWTVEGESTLPEGVWREHSFDNFLDEGARSQTVRAGLYLMEDGRLFLREEGREDREITDAFTGEPQSFSYRGSDGAMHTGQALGSYEVSYPSGEGEDTQTITRIADESGALGYLMVRGSDGTAGLLCAEGCDEEALLCYWDPQRAER